MQTQIDSTAIGITPQLRVATHYESIVDRIPHMILKAKLPNRSERPMTILRA